MCKLAFTISYHPPSLPTISLEVINDGHMNLSVVISALGLWHRPEAEQEAEKGGTVNDVSSTVFFNYLLGVSIARYSS
jgi:hypothetical protein